MVECGNDPCQNLMCELRHSMCYTKQPFTENRAEYQMDCCDSKGPAMEGSRCDMIGNGTVQDYSGLCKNGECVGMKQ